MQVHIHHQEDKAEECINQCQTDGKNITLLCCGSCQYWQYRKGGQQRNFHTLPQKIKDAPAVKGNIAGQDASKDGRGCGNQHEADRVHQHHSKFAEKVRHLIDRHNPELFEHIILVFVIHQHGTQHPQHHRQDNPRGIAERRPLVKLDGFHAGSLNTCEVEHGGQRHKQSCQQHEPDKCSPAQL